MDKSYTYLLINGCTVFFPLLLSFDKRVQFARSWKYLWPAMAISGLVFLGWDVLFTIKGVWWFNPRYLTGIQLFHLPVEEILFFLTVPYACIFIDACLKYYIKWQAPVVVGKLISVLLLLLCLAMLLLYHQRLYTLVVSGLLFTLLILALFIFKARWLSRFYFTCLVALIPFFIVNGILTGIPIVSYNPAENMHIRIGTIPVEDIFYLIALLLLNMGFFEYFKSPAKLTRNE